LPHGEKGVVRPGPAVADHHRVDERAQPVKVPDGRSAVDVT
jgi:hypothetical protein